MIVFKIIEYKNVVCYKLWDYNKLDVYYKGWIVFIL